MDYEERIPKRGSINPLMTGVAGAVIGAGLAWSASYLMSNKKARDRVFHTITGIREKAREGIDLARERVGEMVEERGRSKGRRHA